MRSAGEIEAVVDHGGIWRAKVKVETGRLDSCLDRRRFCGVGEPGRTFDAERRIIECSSDGITPQTRHFEWFGAGVEQSAVSSFVLEL